MRSVPNATGTDRDTQDREGPATIVDMYNPAHFRVEDVSVARELIRDYPLATLVTVGLDGVEANHIPVILVEGEDGLGTLYGHVSRANPIHGHRGEVLAIFQGPTAYISPNWYASKAEHHKVVPTYNYAVVHARGPLVLHDDADWLLAHLPKLTDAMEAGQSVPWKVSDAPDDFIRSQVKGIVGIEIPVERWEGKWKVSQNRSADDREGVARNLQGQEMADLVRLWPLAPGSVPPVVSIKDPSAPLVPSPIRTEVLVIPTEAKWLGAPLRSDSYAPGCATACVSLLSFAICFALLPSYGLCMVGLAVVGSLLAGAAEVLVSRAVEVKRLALDLDQLEDPDSADICFAKVTIVVDNEKIGSDRGACFFDSGALHFVGRATTFTIGGQDIVPSRDRHDAPGVLDTDSHTEDLLQLRHPHRSVWLLIQAVPRPGGRARMAKEAFENRFDEFKRSPQPTEVSRTYPPLRRFRD